MNLIPRLQRGNRHIDSGKHLRGHLLGLTGDAKECAAFYATFTLQSAAGTVDSPEAAAAAISIIGVIAVVFKVRLLPFAPKAKTGGKDWNVPEDSLAWTGRVGYNLATESYGRHPIL